MKRQGRLLTKGKYGLSFNVRVVVGRPAASYVSAEYRAQKNIYFSTACINHQAAGGEATPRGWQRSCGAGRGASPRRAAAAAIRDLHSRMMRRSSAYAGFGRK